MSLAVDDFEEFHERVHKSPPFSWQSRLLREVIAKKAWPRVLDLPTGAGKTTCIDIALFALALDAQDPAARWCPRRIAMVVDRRVVVDQVAERGRKILRALLHTGGSSVVVEVARLLRSLSREQEEPIGVFTLRGGMPKDDTWARTPDQPLVLASTVDQLGSRLLIQGYGVSAGMKPVHAGLLGSDVLLLLDEVHLSRPFAETLDQLDRLRMRFRQASVLPARFQHVFLSATPGATEGDTFRLAENEKGTGSRLGARLHVSKKVRLADVEDRPSLEKACVDRARALIAQHAVVAIVVNRVATASIVARQVREAVGETADVALLTGRMRPLDRDDSVAKIKPRIQTDRDRATVEKKLIVVGTQCIEAGADFDFDAMVTEAASLDALRQRFGRVDRIGSYAKAEGIILRDKSAKDDDPVYGGAISKTVAWLKANLEKKGKTIDFGVLALPLPEQDQLELMVAPTEHAPILLPAYLDLWMQTSPPPVQVPDVSLWLHGPRSGPPDVQVVWRADLSEGVLEAAYRSGQTDPANELPSTIVAAVRPSSLEAISIPFAAARHWLSGEKQVDIADVEGAAVADRGDRKPGRLVLRWDGSSSSVIHADELIPGNTIVVPASYGGIRDACFDPTATDPVVDIAERAALVGRGQPLMRLHPDLLGTLPGLPSGDLDVNEVKERLEAAAASEPPGWRKCWYSAIARSKTVIVVDAEEPWMVLEGKRLSARELRDALQGDDASTLEDGVDLTTDEDDSSFAGRPVSLAEHSQDVERFARTYAAAAGLPEKLVDDIALAGWLHDIGKADRRFQIMLRGGSEIEFFKDERPLAKSGMPRGAKAAQRMARERSGYPKGTRHEVQSLAMIEKHMDIVRAKAQDIDLVLHLVGSHHGFCRPFAPAITDGGAVDVVLPDHKSTTFGTVKFGATSSNNQLFQLDSPLGSRFWGLVEKYGWQELCWLEAILRLADHRASESEQTAGEPS